MTKKELREQEEIKMCLSCPRPECVNCLGDKHGTLVAKHEAWKGLLLQCVAEGLNNQQIAGRLGIHYNTVTKLRGELGIPAQKGRRPKNGQRPS